MPNIILTEQAEADLDSIWDYIAPNNRLGAKKLLNTINQKLKTLSQNPYLGRNREEFLPHLRSFVINNYMIFYFPLEEGIEVIRILHGARDVETFF